MQIQSLKLFCDVAGMGSFSDAARENSVTQSTASQTVQNLEERLGVSLIDRSQRPWKLTEEGRKFHEGCRDLIKRYQDLETKVRGLHQQVISTVRTGAIYSVGLRHMNLYIKKFSELYPGVQVQLEYLHPERVLESVLNEELDMGIISFPPQKKELEVIHWHEELMVIACRSDHAFALKQEIAVKKIAGESFIGFDRGLVVRREVDRFLKRCGISVKPVMEFDNIEAIKRAIEAGSGISILPRPAFEAEIRRGSMCAVHMKNENFVRPLGIICRRGRELNENAVHFLEFLKKGKKSKQKVKV
jgi:DNA-binding transcriptional LysR family regulator